MEEKSDVKTARRMAKELRHEFFEENDYVELDPKDSKLPCCADAFQDFDAQTHDAWLMQCPKGMDPQQLVGKRIKLPGRRYIGDLQVRASNYATPLSEAVGYVNRKGKYALRKLPLTGCVVVSKRLKANKPGQDELVTDTEFPAAPAPPKYNLPVRHPFFGRDYKRRIDLPAALTNALKKADKKHAKTTAKLRHTADYYTIKSKMMQTAQTLEEKELEVRQSVVTGIRPGFMRSTAAPSIYHSNGSVVEIKQEPEETNGVAQINGHHVVEIKEEPTTPKKQKKRKSNGEILANGTPNLQDSLAIVKEEPEPESQPKKRRKRKSINEKPEESEVQPEKPRKRKAIDENVVVKQEEEDAVAKDTTPRKRKKLKAVA